ncbi:MAG: N-acetylmuramoyl-L-alanine amidase [Ignavibacteriae bacterium]|nr:MAG: N-acetylmuramoyl-L-alanine amidase [Ignavibacteriota bacterium]
MLRQLFIVFLFTSSLLAQVKIDTTQAPSSAQTKLATDSLFLRVQRPDNDTIRTFGSHYRIAACTRPDAKAFINGKQSKVYASGAFVDLLHVNVDTNTYRFTVKAASGDSLWKEFVIIRPQPMKNSSHDTLVIEQAMMEPAEDLWLTSGDVLELKFKGSPGWEASCDIPDVESGIPMRELSPSEGGGFTGVYIGRYIVKPEDETRDVQIKFRLKKNFWSRTTVLSKAKLSILPKELPRAAEVIGKRPYLNAGLGVDRLGGSKLGFLQEGVLVEIIGKVGSQYRIKLSASMEAWLPEEFARLLPPDTPLPRGLAGAISATSSGDEEIVAVVLSDKLPYTSDLSVNPNAIIVDIYGATSNTNWISQSRFVKGIESITWKQLNTDQYRIIIDLSHPHWGYDIDYAGKSLRIKIRKPPVITSSESVLSGLTIAVDAGHGGDNKGAVGATGALEKELNISMAYHLDSLLAAKGAKVILTRTEADVPFMAERINKIVQSDACLLVSIHCNSAGDASDPLALRGVSVYYRPIGFKPLADMMYDKMLALGLKQFGEVGGFNFTLNALTQLPNVLVETAFLSNPEDEILLLDDGFRKKVAEQIVKGLEEFVKAYAEMKTAGK